MLQSGVVSFTVEILNFLIEFVRADDKCVPSVIFRLIVRGSGGDEQTVSIGRS